MLTAADIAAIVSAPGSFRIRIATQEGTVTISKQDSDAGDPVPSVVPSGRRRGRPANPDKADSAARMRQLRSRRKNDVTENVTENIHGISVTPALNAGSNGGDVTENVTENIHEISVTQSDLPSPPSPPPSPPTPSPSAPASPTPPKGKRLRDEATGFADACRVALDLTASPRLQAAWAEWQQYRQRRHNQTGNDKLEWSLQAARLTANQVVRYAEAHGEQIVIDRITTAIAGRWQGPNLDKLETPKPKPETREEIRSHYNPNRWDTISPISPKTSSQG